MRKGLFALVILSILFLTGCAPKDGATQEERLTPIEKCVKETAARASRGGVYLPISIRWRKLQLDEIAEHLDMDLETAKLHLKTTNIHGYYSLIARNFPVETDYTLYHIDVSGKVTASKHFFVNGNGMLVTQIDDTYVNFQNNFLFFSNYLPGEPADFVLASKDGKAMGATRIVPNPVQKTDEQNRYISVEMASADKKKYTVHCSGFKPHGTYLLTARFENEKLVYPLEADSKGEMFELITPCNPYFTGGDASVELRGDEIVYPIVLEYQWGA